MLKINYEGREYEFVGYNTSQEATHYLDPDGNLREKMAIFSIRGTAWFRLVPVRHTFGRIVFEEIGVRRINPGEWFIQEHNGEIMRYVNEFPTNTGVTRIILKPVEVLDD